MKPLLLTGMILLGAISSAPARPTQPAGLASWYGETHRGRFMANGKRFDPAKLTAASWFYPLGTKLRVTLDCPGKPARSVRVTVTDRGPAKELVQQGRIIDLTEAAFHQLAPPESGLVHVKVQRLR